MSTLSSSPNFPNCRLVITLTTPRAAGSIVEKVMENTGSFNVMHQPYTYAALNEKTSSSQTKAF